MTELVAPEIGTDAFNLLCGKLLGSGVYRDVFECKLNDSLVVKVEIQNDNGYRTFMNVQEMHFWNMFNSIPAVKQWCAPCEFLSPDGHILLQKRVEPLRAADRASMPDKLPAFLTDLKYDNFGLLDGRIVCVDYGGCIMNPETKLRKAEWW